MLRLAAALAVAAGLLLGQGVIAAPSASAHGKELGITVIPLTPDPERPLARLYRVSVVFANDLEPVEGAEVILTATRQDGDLQTGAMPLTEVEGTRGLYVGEITYSRFGVWEVELRVTAPNEGDGKTAFEDNIRPGALTPAAEAALRAEGERIVKLQLFFGFDWWPDVVNVVMRIVHSLSAITYFLVTGAAFALAWFGVPAARRDLPIRLKRYFLPAAFGSLLLLLGAGLYGAAYDAPIRAPGLYDVSGMLRIPFGEWYLGAFMVKLAMFVLLLLLAVRIRRSLRAWPASGPGAAVHAGAGSVIATLRRETAINAAVGLVVVADVAVVIYLHYISHLGVFLPEG